jgi:hypothetical protein
MNCKVGDAISLEGKKIQLVLCRGTVINIVDGYATIDGLNYFCSEGNDQYRITLKDATDDTSDEDYYFPFQRVPGLSYGVLGKDESKDILFNLSDESVKKVEGGLMEVWKKMYPNSEIEPNIKEGIIKIICSDDEYKDVTDLITDKVNIFSKLTHESDREIYKIILADGNDLLSNYLSFINVKGYLDTLLECNYRIIPNENLVNLNNIGRRSFQWEVWAMCNNYCTYCYLGQDNRHTDKVRQMKSLIDLHKAIDNLDYRIYNNISLIGGDFFQGQLDDPEVHDSFMALIEKCAKAYSEDKIGSMWITCTLTIGDQKHLYEMIEIFEKYKCFPREGWSASGIWLCTSWDIKGRFHTPDRLENWDYHMLNIQKTYPWIKFNTTIILMEDFMRAVIDHKWSPREFSEKYKTTLFFKQVGLGQIVNEQMFMDDCLNPIKAYSRNKIAVNERLGFDFCPHRRTSLDFLRVFATEYPEFYDRLYNIQYRADELHRNFNDNMNDLKTKRNKHSANETDVAMENSLNVCGHMINYMPYIDSDKCCICDKKAIWESIYGA